MRGRTTQNFVSSTRYGSAFLTSSTVTRISCRVPNSSDLTTPTSRLLNLTLVFPASSPSAVLNEIVIVGPLSKIPLTTIHPPTKAATMGISHTSCGAERRFLTATAVGTSSRPVPRDPSNMMPLFRLPEQPWIKGHRRKHGQHNHGTERGRSGTWLNGGQ